MKDITRRNILKYAALGSLSVSLGGIPTVSIAQSVDSRYVLIKGGSFHMGSPTNEPIREKDEASRQV